MTTKHVDNGIPTLHDHSKTRRKLIEMTASIGLIGALIGAAAPAVASETTSAANCGETYDPNATYPSLPKTHDADISGEAGIVMFLHEDRGVVERDGCFYSTDRPITVDFATLDFVTVLIELPDHAAGGRVFVTEDGVLLETIDVQGNFFSYVLTSDHSLGFEIAAPSQAAPTVPPIVTKPHDPEPD